jgi:hypothetical protein
MERVLVRLDLNCQAAASDATRLHRHAEMMDDAAALLSTEQHAVTGEVHATSKRNFAIALDSILYPPSSMQPSAQAVYSAVQSTPSMACCVEAEVSVHRLHQVNCLELAAVSVMPGLEARIAVRKLQDRQERVGCTVYVLPTEYATALQVSAVQHVNSTQTAMQTTQVMSAHHKVYVRATIWAIMALEVIWAEIWATTTTPMPSTLLPMTRASIQLAKTWYFSSKSTGRRLSDCRFEAWPMKVPTTL